MKRKTFKKCAALVVFVGIAAAQSPRFEQPLSAEGTPAIVKRPLEIPSGTVPSGCVRFLQKGDAAGLIDCYLKDASNQTIARAISWGFNNQNTRWAQWPAWAKQDLATAFIHTVDWYNGGMVKYTGVLAPDGGKD